MPAGTTKGGQKTSEGHRGHPEKASPTAVSRYLKGVDFPCGKDDLLQHAKNNHAPDDVQKVIQRLKDTQYHTMAEVTKAVGEAQ